MCVCVCVWALGKQKKDTSLPLDTDNTVKEGSPERDETEPEVGNGVLASALAYQLAPWAIQEHPFLPY